MLRYAGRVGATKQGYLWIVDRILMVTERANPCWGKERYCARVIAIKITQEPLE